MLETSTATTSIETTPAHNLSKSCYQFTSDDFDAGGITIPHIVNAALNVPLAIVATLANILVFPAIRKSPSLHLPSKLLHCNLVVTDLGVGLVVQPLFVAFLIARAYDPAGIPCSFVSFAAVCGATLAGVSLMTMSAILKS